MEKNNKLLLADPASGSAPSSGRQAGWSVGAVANVVCFCVFLTVFGIMALVLPKNGTSEIEKRELARMPPFSYKSLLSGGYTEGIDLYVADTFPGRDGLVMLAHEIGELRGVRPGEVRIYETPASSSSAQSEPSTQPEPSSEAQESPALQPLPDSSSEQSAESSSPPPEQSGESEAGTPLSQEEQGQASQFGSVLIYKDRAVALFGGTASMSEYYAQTISGYQERLPDVTVYNLVAPCSAEFYLPEQYRNLSSSQKANIDHIYESLDPSVLTVNAYDALARHADEYIYFRTDHHWTALGAYYAYTAFCETAGLEPRPLSEMELRSREGFLGTLYAQTMDGKLQQNPDRVDYYILPDGYEALQYQKNRPYSPNALPGLWGEYASMTNSYSIFLHGDWPLVRIDTEHKNGRRIAVVKESYGNAFVPYLLSHYESIFVIDERYFQTSLVKLMEENEIGELLFLNNIFAANTQYHINNIRYLADQVWTPPPPEPPEEEEESSEEE